jgi:hypothetical protein
MNRPLRRRPTLSDTRRTATGILLLGLMLGVTTQASADDATASSAPGNPEVIELDATTISGHRELPRVMHVVPWKRALPADLHGRPINSLLDDVLAPVDRDEFRRQLRYHNALEVSASMNRSDNPSQNPGD